MTDLNRVISVSIGPKKEIDTTTNTLTETAITYIGGGGINDFSIDCSVTKTTGGTPSVTIIEIQNISLESVTKITKGLAVIVSVGFENGSLSIISSGTIISVNMINEPANPTKTVIIKVVADISGISFGVFKNSYQNNTDLKKIILDVSDKIKGLQVNEEDIQVEKKTGKKGYVAIGTCNNILNEICNNWGLSWCLSDKRLIVKDDTKLSGDNDSVIELSAELQNLISINQKVSGDFGFKIGVEIRAVLLPSVVVFDKIKVTSVQISNLSGEYTATNIIHAFSTKSNRWETKIECLFSQDEINKANQTTQ